MHLPIALTPHALFKVVRANISQTNPSKTRLKFLVGSIYQLLIDSSYLDTVTLVTLHPCLLCASPALNYLHLFLFFTSNTPTLLQPLSYLFGVETTCFFSSPAPWRLSCDDELTAAMKHSGFSYLWPLEVNGSEEPQTSFFLPPRLLFFCSDCVMSASLGC